MFAAAFDAGNCPDFYRRQKPLVTENGVALVPGAAFGDDRWVRLSYAAATPDIEKGLDRIVAFAKKLGD